MIIGVLSLQISVFDAMTLKDKRRVIKSLKDRIRNKYNVSIAEVDNNDNIRTSVLGVALVANKSRFVESVLSDIVNFVRNNTRSTLIDYNIELL